VPITDTITFKRYLEYQAGRYHMHFTTQFKFLPPPGHFRPEHPDSAIFRHDWSCPHHDKDADRIYDRNLLPPDYVNHETESCIDFQQFRHAGHCPHSDYNVLEDAFARHLTEIGRPAYIRQEWDDTDHHGVQRHVVQLGCPLCGVGNGPVFGYCEHAKETHTRLRGHTGPGHITPECDEGVCTWAYWHKCMEQGPLVRMTTFEGLVLDTYPHTLAGTTDEYAVVWDAVTRSVRSIGYASDGYYCTAYARVDATDEVIAEAARSKIPILASKKYEASVADAQRMRKGARVRAVEKVTRAKRLQDRFPIGTTGTIVQLSESSFGSGLRVCFLDDTHLKALPMDKGMHYRWCDSAKLEVIDWEKDVINPQEAWDYAVTQAASIAARREWRHH
jgi:hypothetical protein